MFVSNFVFFDSSSTELTSNALGNANNGSALVLQVDNFGVTQTLGLKVEGAVDLNNPNDYFPIKVVSMETFKTIAKITSPGIYLAIIDGVSKIRMTSDYTPGSFKAYAVSVT